MMDEMSEDLREYLDALNKMAQSGQSLPIMSGFVLAWWGAILTLASIASLIVIDRGRSDLIAYIWPIVILAGWVGSRLIRVRLGLDRRDGAAAYPNRSSRAIWLAAGAVSSLLIGLESFELIDLAGRAYVIVFFLCGLALVATAYTVSEPLLLLSAGGWIASGFVSLFIDSSQMAVFALTAVTCGVFLAIPGLIIGLRK